MKAIRARASIKSTPADVFRVLTNFDSYQHWNPWLTDVQGEAKVGTRVKVKPNLVSLLGYKLRYRLAKIQAPDFMLWEEEAWFHLFFRTEREYQVFTKSGGGSIYSMNLRFYGPLAPIVSFFYRRAVRKGLNQCAESLKRYCEAKYPLPPVDVKARSRALNLNDSSPDLDFMKI